MKQYDIGLDLGTTSIIIATQEQGVVFHQPSIGAVDTRSSTILAVGDKALRMVGRVP
ncbi:MAG: rod shape-determining protein, partial [Gemmiger qucibialis]